MGCFKLYPNTGKSHKKNLVVFKKEDRENFLFSSKSSVRDYQYHLKDHLGNTRVSFTTQDRVTPSLAEFEDNTVTNDTQYFDNSQVNRIAHPNTGIGGKVQRLNNATPIGANKSFGVVPGDIIDVSVKAYYTQTSGFGTGATNSGAFANAVSSAFGGANGGGAESEEQFIFDLFTALGTALLTPAGNSDNKPSAYLNYLVFDQDYVLNTAKSGFVGVNTGANAEQNLSATNIEITEAGYIYIYLSYESPSVNYVYFDDLDITVHESRILGKDDFYPFGAMFSSYSKSGMINQNFKYQGKEMMADLGLNVFDFHARFYDPFLGRTSTHDPHSDGYYNLSPYSWVGNNPIRSIDPDGKDFKDVLKGIKLLPSRLKNAGGEIAKGFSKLGDKIADAYDALPSLPNVIMGGNGQMEDDSNLPAPNPDAKSIIVDIDETKEILDVLPTKPNKTSTNKKLTKEKNTSQKTNDKVNGQDKVAKSTTGSTEEAAKTSNDFTLVKTDSIVDLKQVDGDGKVFTSTVYTYDTLRNEQK